MKNSNDTSWDRTNDLPRFVAQHLNHCATAVPTGKYRLLNLEKCRANLGASYPLWCLMMREIW